MKCVHIRKRGKVLYNKTKKTCMKNRQNRGGGKRISSKNPLASIEAPHTEGGG